MRIAEIPIVLHRDKRGRPPHLRSFRDGWRHLRFILTYAPSHVFMAPGSLLLAVGLVLLGLLATGPTTVFGHFLGPHFLALGSLLTLAGFNVLSLGILAKVILARKHPSQTGRIVRWANGPRAMETCLVAGVACAAAGFAIDVAILVRWLSEPLRPMDDTVHPAIVATTLIVLGINLAVTAFILNLLVTEADRERAAGNAARDD